MKGKILIALLLLGTVSVNAREGSFIRQATPRDSILVADRLLYGFELEDVPDSIKLAFPEVQSPLMQDVLALPVWQVDTLKIRKIRASNARLLTIRAQIAIQPFEEGVYDLPPLQVQRIRPDGTSDTLQFDPQQIDVRTMPVDTATYVPHDLRGQIRYPLTMEEVVPWVLGLWGVALLVAGVAAWIGSRRRKEEGAAFREPAHITALRKLDRFRGDKYWAPDKQKQFYSGVTDALREYIVARYGVGAMEMTTAEIFADLRRTDVPADLYEEMKGLFERADFVKFAKFVASPEDNATVLPQAIRFVTSTYQAEVEEEAAQEEADPAPAAPEARHEEKDEDYMPK